jgi:hypothetical protein
VDSRGIGGIRRLEEIPDYPTHSGSPGTPRKLADLHIGYKQCGWYDYHGRRGGGESDTNRKIQYQVYFVSKVLSDSKARYFHVMKLGYALLIKSCKLCPYFQVHEIEVHTSSTLGEILNNREAIGKFAKWAIHLSMYDIVNKRRTAIKAQALRNFVADWIET